MAYEPFLSLWWICSRFVNFLWYEILEGCIGAKIGVANLFVLRDPICQNFRTVYRRYYMLWFFFWCLSNLLRSSEDEQIYSQFWGGWPNLFMIWVRRLDYSTLWIGFWVRLIFNSLWIKLYLMRNILYAIQKMALSSIQIIFVFCVVERILHHSHHDWELIIIPVK